MARSLKNYQPNKQITMERITDMESIPTQNDWVEKSPLGWEEHEPGLMRIVNDRKGIADMIRTIPTRIPEESLTGAVTEREKTADKSGLLEQSNSQLTPVKESVNV